MTGIEELLSSGLLELYVLGETSEEETIYIQEMILSHQIIADEVNQIELALTQYAMENAIAPDPIVKPFLLAVIDYTDRLQNGEAIASPPLLNQYSTASDYQEWINRTDMQLTEDLDDVFAKIIAFTETCTTAIVWIKDMAPQEVHDHEYEKFLILEGTCTIHIEDEQHELKAGDFLTIPLFKKHHVRVTSTIPCKVILQRVAA